MNQYEKSRNVRDCYSYWLREGASMRRWYDANANEDDKLRRHTGAVLTQVRKLVEKAVANYEPAGAKPQPVPVLEFGCGNGRHLKAINSALSHLPIVTYGFDISPGIVDETINNVRIGHPCEPLSYVTGEFDITFTCTSLIHVHPDDLQGVLEELVRVTATGGTLLHFEPQKQFDFAPDHGGVWGLDLTEAYRKIGFAAEYVDEKPFGFWRLVKPSVAEFVAGKAAEAAWNEAGDTVADMLTGKPGAPVTVEGDGTGEALPPISDPVEEREAPVRIGETKRIEPSTANVAPVEDPKPESEVVDDSREESTFETAEPPISPFEALREEDEESR